MPNPDLLVRPEAPLVDERLRIELRGLDPGSRVALHAEIEADDGVCWSSSAHFEVDAGGVVNLDAQAPLSGSYACADAMGMIWAIHAAFHEDGPVKPSSS